MGDGEERKVDTLSELKASIMNMISQYFEITESIEKNLKLDL
jgi:hypothetical protein